MDDNEETIIANLKQRVFKNWQKSECLYAYSGIKAISLLGGDCQLNNFDMSVLYSLTYLSQGLQKWAGI